LPKRNLIVVSQDAGLLRASKEAARKQGLAVRTLRSPAELKDKSGGLFLVDCDALESPVLPGKIGREPERVLFVHSRPMTRRLEAASTHAPIAKPVTSQALARALTDAFHVQRLVRRTRRLAASKDDLSDGVRKLTKHVADLQERISFLEEQTNCVGSILKRSGMLARMSEDMNCLNMDEIAAICVEKVPALMEAHYVSLYLYDYANHTLVLRKHNHPRRIARVVDLEKESGSLMARALRSGQLMLVKDLEALLSKERTTDGKDGNGRKYRALYHTASCIIAPLRSGNRTVGVLNIADKVSGAQFDEAYDLPTVEHLTALLGAAIRNCQLYMEVTQRARTDSLTGFLNHRFFFEELGTEINRAQRFHSPLSLMMIDIDDFKNLNDTHGHPTGDYVLRSLARIVARSIRNVDIPARYGGDEFAIILTHTDLANARKIATRVKRAITGHRFEHEGLKLDVTLSFGVAEYKAPMTADRLVKHADSALYLAKAAGKNTIKVFEPEKGGT